MQRLKQRGEAKVKLTLRVLGRRPDGYHSLESMVAFADVADELVLTPGAPTELSVEGPFAAALTGDNLIRSAIDAALRQAPGLRVGHVRLRKHLPVSAGLGGGSADAAAMLRLLAAANPERGDRIDWQGLAASLGSDVPVCLYGRAALIAGRGELVRPLPPLPPVFAVLANPGVPLATADVFRAIDAEPLTGAAVASGPPEPRAFADATGLAQGIAAVPNDLEAAAIRLCPQISTVRAALAQQPGALLIRMSGSGPTCFALFADEALARAAHAEMTKAEPGWWVAAGALR